eukprot:361663-Chlamydomonas_euryale.AAC.1
MSGRGCKTRPCLLVGDCPAQICTSTMRQSQSYAILIDNVNGELLIQRHKVGLTWLVQRRSSRSWPLSVMR